MRGDRPERVANSASPYATTSSGTSTESVNHSLVSSDSNYCHCTLTVPTVKVMMAKCLRDRDVTGPLTGFNAAPGATSEPTSTPRPAARALIRFDVIGYQ